MKLWGGRFQKDTDQLVNELNASIGFDQRLYREDITGSIAHARMLADCGIISKEDAAAITSGLEGILNTLDRTGVSALFLFPTDSLAENAAWIRQMVGSGHAVGLCTSAGTGEEALDDLEKGSRLLEEIVRLRPHIALAESGDSAVIQTLEGAGWTCWQTNADGIPSEGENSSSLAYSILETVELKQSRARVLMDDSTVSAGALSRVLSGLREEDYNIRLPVETEL